MKEKHRLLQVLRALVATLLSIGGATSVHARGSSVSFSPIGTDNLLQVAFGLGLVVIAILVAARVAKRLFRVPSGMTGQLKIVCGISMGARERVVLLQAGKTQLLLGVSPGRIQTLHVLDEPLTPSEDALVEPSEFASRLTSTLSRRSAKRNG